MDVELFADEIRQRFVEGLAGLEPGRRAEIFAVPEPYVEEADANPERRANGCQIYRVN